MSIKKPEIMAPAGNKAALNAALKAGCDAVYFGMTNFSMRAAASNFTNAGMKELVRMCHAKGVRAYVTINVVIYESEKQKLRKALQTAKDAGVDAVICWDYAVVMMAHEMGIEAMVSTQMSVSNSSAMIFLNQQFGIKRFVLARECTLKDLIRIRKELKDRGLDDVIEIEVFAHGAMCVAVSGRCFMSENAFGKSGNRGECRQPCRREYHVTDVDGKVSFDLGHNYVMSPKDLCTIPFIEKLLKAGVNSLKIEGRNRSPEYVYTTVKAYRDVVDFYYANKGRKGWREQFDAVKEAAFTEVSKVYNRGFSDGFYMGQPINEWVNGGGNQATIRKMHLGQVRNYYQKAGIAQVRVEGQQFKIGDTLQFEGPNTGMVQVIVEHMLDEDDTPVTVAQKGMLVTLKVPEKVRRTDRLYVLRERK